MKKKKKESLEFLEHFCMVSFDLLSDLEKQQRPRLETPLYRQRNRVLKGLFGSFNTKLLRDNVKTWAEISYPLPWTFSTWHLYDHALWSGKNRASPCCMPAKCSAGKGRAKFRRGVFSMMRAMGKTQGEARKKGHPVWKSSSLIQPWRQWEVVQTEKNEQHYRLQEQQVESQKQVDQQNILQCYRFIGLTLPPLSHPSTHSTYIYGVYVPDTVWATGGRCMSVQADVVPKTINLTISWHLQTQAGRKKAESGRYVKSTS